MPAEGPVKMIWQIIFSFIPILDLWSRYRIKKLGKYILYVYVPIFVSTFGLIGVFAMMALDDPTSLESLEDSDSAAVTMMTVVFSLFSVGITILSIYLVYRWTIEWNKQFGVSSYDSE